MERNLILPNVSGAFRVKVTGEDELHQPWQQCQLSRSVSRSTMTSTLEITGDDVLKKNGAVPTTRVLPFAFGFKCKMRFGLSHTLHWKNFTLAHSLGAFRYKTEPHIGNKHITIGFTLNCSHETGELATSHLLLFQNNTIFQMNLKPEIKCVRRVISVSDRRSIGRGRSSSQSHLREAGHNYCQPKRCS